MSGKSQVTQALEQYSDKKKFNSLVPTQTFFDAVGPFHKLTVETVQVSPDPEDGDVYSLKSFGAGDLFGFSKPGLMKFAYAAGILFVPQETHRVDDASNPDRVEFKATGVLKKADGTYRVVTCSYEFDLVNEEKILRNVAKKKKLSEQWVQDRILQYRKHKVARADTGAHNRVIRELLALKSGYTKDELAKPFAVPRIDFMPDLTDPVVKRAMIDKFSRAEEAVFGAPPSPPPAVTHSVSNGQVAEDAVVSDAESEEEKPTVEEIREILKDELFTEKERELFENAVKDKKGDMKKLENRKKAFSWASTQKDKREILRKEAGEEREGQQEWPWNGE